MHPTFLSFLGGTRTVTGSRFLVEWAGSKVLVDCGLYQGLKELRERNWEQFPVDPAGIDAVLLTHAHVDHCGYLPALVRDGFRGRVLATAGTRALCEIVLRDSGRLQEEEAAYANRRGYSRHHPALPLYTEEDAEAALGHFRVASFDEEVEAARGVRARFRPAGHILGSASLELAVGDAVRLGVSGDLGRPAHPLLVPPAAPPAADTLLLESTYGDREHAEVEPAQVLGDAVARTADRGGVVVVPAFAVDRTEIVLMALRRLEVAGRIPSLPVYVDSPMALAALGVYRRAIAEGWDEIRPELRGDERPFDTGQLIEARSVDESKEIGKVDGPAIVVSASGMATGGRVLHHLAQRLPDARNAVVLVGFQPVGTRGRRLLDGERAVKMLGRYVPVRAEIVDANHFSVHADRSELLAWLGSAPEPPGLTFAVHGEEQGSQALADAVADTLGWAAVVPRLFERVRVPPRGG